MINACQKCESLFFGRSVLTKPFEVILSYMIIGNVTTEVFTSQLAFCRTETQTLISNSEVTDTMLTISLFLLCSFLLHETTHYFPHDFNMSSLRNTDIMLILLSSTYQIIICLVAF